MTTWHPGTIQGRANHSNTSGHSSVTKLINQDGLDPILEYSISSG